MQKKRADQNFEKYLSLFFLSFASAEQFEKLDMDALVVFEGMYHVLGLPEITAHILRYQTSLSFWRFSETLYHLFG